MDIKDDMEEGEISDISDGEEPLGGYTLLERPVTAKAILPKNNSNGKFVALPAIIPILARIQV